MSLLATAERDSAFSNAKPYRRACRRHDNPMPFNDSDWFRKDDDVRRHKAETDSNGERSWR